MLSEIQIPIHALVQDYPLSQQLRESTQEVHSLIESNPLIDRIFKLKITRDEYVLLLNSFKSIYRAMEKSLEKTFTNQELNSFQYEKLKRLQSIDSDLNFWGVRDIELFPALSVALSNYVQRIHKIEMEAPHLLWSHLYVRYFGDLSGGQMMAKILAKNFGSAEGLSFYDFGEKEEIAVIKKDFRWALDQFGENYMKFTDDIVEEAKLAFKLNDSLYKALLLDLSDNPRIGQLS